MQQNTDDTWSTMLTDGLHSVRGLVNESGGLIEAADYDPYGVPDAALTGTDFAFTGEMRDANGLQYHRARYYTPSLGVFPSLDPFEGMMQRPMSLNGYSWVEGDVVNAIDPTGMQQNVADICVQNPQFCAWAASQLGPIILPSGAVVTGGALLVLVPLGLLYNLYNSNPSGLTDQQRHDFLCQHTAPGVRPSNCSSNSMIIATPSAPTNPDTTNPNPTQSVGGISQNGNISVASPEDLLDLCLFINNGICEPNFSPIPPGLNASPAFPDGVAVLPDGTIVSPYILESRSRRVSQIRERTETIAEHIAKLLGETVGGYPPSAPNPNRDPDGGWCQTIKRSIEVIDNLGLSQNQFNRDFADTGLGFDYLDEVKDALQRLKDAGWCDDFWDDFDGGSFAT